MAWEVKWTPRRGRKVRARNLESPQREARKWHWVDSCSPRFKAVRPPIRKDTWEADLSRKAPIGYVWARNPFSRAWESRKWHLVLISNLRRRGVDLPSHRNAWEIEWSKRQRRGRTIYVWARNPASKNRSCREWHWVPASSLYFAGIEWVKRAPPPPRIDSTGYRVIPFTAMTPEQQAAAKQYGLYRLGHPIHEHRLVASMKYRRNLAGVIVRHKNGIKTDNRPANLLIGTYADNTCDHDTARRKMIYWKARCLRAEKRLKEIRCQLSQPKDSGRRLVA